jgi:hypothetical protein
MKDRAKTWEMLREIGWKSCKLAGNKSLSGPIAQ